MPEIQKYPQPIVFMAQPDKYRRISSDELLKWEQAMRECVGISRSGSTFRGVETWSFLDDGQDYSDDNAVDCDEL